MLAGRCSTWDDGVPALNAAGLRTIVPTLRGCGATSFVDGSIARTGNSAILAMDMIALLDRLGIDRFMVAGHDWGSNLAEALVRLFTRDPYTVADDLDRALTATKKNTLLIASLAIAGALSLALSAVAVAQDRKPPN